jgi:2-polyprenyl-3-methyl-5-hydroxy-6-metoxy-1,4-benzoquinol methylase
MNPEPTNAGNPANLNTREYWDSVYRTEYESGEARKPGYKRDYAPLHEAVVELIPDGSRVLELACGAGLLCRKIKQRRPGSQVLGVDFSAYVVARNQERDRALGVEYRCLDIRASLGGLGRSFDVVTMCEILEHLEEPEAMVARALDLLRAGGRFILTCPHDAEIPDPEHLRTWGHDELFHLLAPYSDTISFTHFPPPYFHVWMLAYLTKTNP